MILASTTSCASEFHCLVLHPVKIILSFLCLKFKTITWQP